MKLMKKSPLTRVDGGYNDVVLHGCCFRCRRSSAGVYHTVVFWLKPDTPKSKVDAIIAINQESRSATDG